jgi:hypothetical protein
VSIQQDTSLFPLLYVFEDTEKPSNKNRYKEVEFDLLFEAIIIVNKEEDSSEALDEIHAQLQIALLNNNPLLKPYCVFIEEKSMEKQFINEAEGHLVNKYTVRYRHVAGNPYQLNPTN